MGKYVVFKDRDFREWLESADPLHKEKLWDLLVPDATVIRRQDRFAVLALWPYGHAMAIVIEALKEQGVEPPQGLLDAADYFIEESMKSELTDFRKLPD